jgi:hypothetical protein
MSYYIAKTVKGFEDSRIVVRSILRGGLSMNNHRWFPRDRSPVHHFARIFKTRAAAEKALNSLVSVGGFDDYTIFEMERN